MNLHGPKTTQPFGILFDHFAQLGILLLYFSNFRGCIDTLEHKDTS